VDDAGDDPSDWVDTVRMETTADTGERLTLKGVNGATGGYDPRPKTVPGAQLLVLSATRRFLQNVLKGLQAWREVG
jgi:hypothetical protein